VTGNDGTQSGQEAWKAGIVRVIGSRSQRTLAAPAEMPGIGFITGTPVRVRLLPAPANAGIVFRRTDLPGSPAVPAHISQVSNTERRTTIGPSATAITLTEHLLAALAGLRIDNCTIELEGSEPPGLDGSAGGFVDLLWRTGAVVQSAPRPILTTERTLIASHGDATIALHPAEAPGLRATYILDYGLHAPIPRQTYTVNVTPENFAAEVARCRTFTTEAEARAFQAQGVAPHLSAAEVVVFGPRGPINNRLRFADEPARHKVLDLLGDLALCGFDLAGHLVAYRSGHTLNVELARQLAAPVKPASLRAA
jgi:UDP-3-O-acyl N-acetylglucosamine deacetylase